MNRFHRRYCGSRRWARRCETKLLPWALQDVDLGDDVLELGPGLGVTTRLLARRVPRLMAVEVEAELADRLGQQLRQDPDLDGRVTVLNGDATALPFPDGSDGASASGGFSAVVCFTMLHHVPSAALQDRLFAEACRVLRPGGVFAGSDSQPSLRFRLVHLFDTMVTVDPATLPARLAAAGFSDVQVKEIPGRVLRFQARKPAAT
jgi:SAM-dependent methyltransferase